MLQETAQDAAAPENQPVTRAAPGTTATRTSATANGALTTQSYNAANQVVGWSYDLAGNLLTDGTTTYGYDALNRLVTQDGTTNTYNGDGVLVQRGTTQYAQDLVAPLSQVLSDGTATYVYGHERLAALGQAWYLGDALGSVRATLDSAGAVQATASYAPFGEPQGSSIAPFGFTGELQDQGLVHLRARWYDPRSGVFTAVDPFSGFPETPYSLHQYQYAYSAPTTWTDPTGACVAYLNNFCASIQTWAAFETAFPYNYPVAPAVAAQRIGDTPRDAAEYAAFYARYADVPLTTFLQADVPLGASAAEVFAVYYLGYSLLQQKLGDPTALTSAVDALDALEVCRPLTDEEQWQRLTFLGILGAMAGADDALNAGGTGPKRLPDQGRTVGGDDPVTHARGARGGSNARGAAGQEALEALYGPGGAPERFTTHAGDDRYVDYVVRRDGRIYAYEAKNNNSRNVPGRPNRELEEIRKDVILRREEPGYTPVWVFFDRGPGQRLQAELDRNSIMYVIHR